MTEARPDAARLDHLVVAAADLEDGRRWMEALLGVRAAGGGKHPVMRTHNALWRLGDAYLEVIAIDPEAGDPGRPRWYGLDEPALHARVAERPRLVTWVIRPAAPIREAAAAAEADLGPVERHHRGEAFWHLTIPASGRPPLGGLMPTLIEWPEGRPTPPELLPEQGLSLTRFTATGGGEALARGLASVGAAGLVRCEEGEPGLSAVISTPGGEVTLD